MGMAQGHKGRSGGGQGGLVMRDGHGHKGRSGGPLS